MQVSISSSALLSTGSRVVEGTYVSAPREPEAPAVTPAAIFVLRQPAISRIVEFSYVSPGGE